MCGEGIKVGILGFGSRGYSFVAPVLDNGLDVGLSTIIDPDISRSKYFLNQAVEQNMIPEDEAKKVRFIGDIDSLEEGELDVLFLTASEKVRARIFEKAVLTGAHLYMEKGLSNDLEGAKTIAGATRKGRTGQKIMMGFNLRYFPLSRIAKEIMESGRIGRVLFIHYIEMLRQTHGAAFFSRWHRDVGTSGGMLITKACHDFDLMSHFIGSKPHEVFCTQDRKMFGMGGDNARDNCHSCDRTDQCEFSRMRRTSSSTRKAKRKYAELYLDENCASTDGYVPDECVWKGETALCDLSSILFKYQNGARSSYSQVLFAPYGNRLLSVFGDRGSLFFDEAENTLIVKDLWNTRTETITPEKTEGSHGGSDAGIVKAFFGMIREDKEPECRIEDGVWALCSAVGAYTSAEEGRWFDVKRLVDSVPEFQEVKG